MILFTKRFWKVAGVRAIKTFAQALVAVLATATVLSEIEWQHALSIGTLAAIVSILTSISSIDAPELIEEGTGHHRADPANNENKEVR